MGEFTRTAQTTDDRTRWRWFLATGVLLVILGLVAAGATSVLEIASILLFGPLLLASSIIQLLTAFLAGPEPHRKLNGEAASLPTHNESKAPVTETRTRSRQLPTKESLFHYADACLEAIIGFLIMIHPVAAITDLAVLVAIFLVVRGLMRVIRSWKTDSSDRGWIVMAGLAALLLGICIWLPLPVSKLWFAGLCLAADFVFHGVVWSAIALTKKKPLEALPS
jgi:uncharacterized membrane protein HdeD (DUF308 family)